MDEETKPYLPDGYEVNQIIINYSKIILPFIGKVPVLYTARFPLILGIKGGLNSCKESISEIFSYIRFILVQNKINVQNNYSADILLYFSSRKASFQPAIDILAERLSEKGLKCVLLTSNLIASVKKSGSKDNINWTETDFFKIFSSRLNKSTVFIMLIRSFSYTFFLGLLLIKNDRKLFWRIFVNPFHVYHEILSAVHRFIVLDNLMSLIKPKLIIGNGDHLPFYSEIAFLAKKRRIFSINFFNEHASEVFLPFISDEIWIWNRMVLDCLKKYQLFSSKQKYRIIGKAEIDNLFLSREKESKEEKVLKRSVKTKQVLVFLSEYVDNQMKSTRESTLQAVSWLLFAARKCPDWFFIFKPRPYGESLNISQIPLSVSVKNFLLINSKISLASLLRWRKTFVLAGLSSTALYVSAGAGKVAIRLFPSRKTIPFPVIDKISIPIYRKDDLVKLLKKLKISKSKVRSKAKKQSENSILFPYKGKVINRMEGLIKEKLLIKY